MPKRTSIIVKNKKNTTKNVPKNARDVQFVETLRLPKNVRDVQFVETPRLIKETMSHLKRRLPQSSQSLGHVLQMLESRRALVNR